MARDWTPLHVHWFEDEVIEAVAELDGSVVLKLWPVLCCLAYRDSDYETNPFGVISTTVKRLAESAHATHDEISATLDLLLDGELITMTSGRLGTLQIALVKFTDRQWPKGSPNDRKQKSRANASREKAFQCPVPVTRASQNVTAGSLPDLPDLPNQTDPTESAGAGRAAVLIPSLPSYEPGDTRAMMAEVQVDEAKDRKRAVEEVAKIVAPVLDGVDPAAYARDELVPKLMAPIKGQRYPLDRGVAAVRQTIAEIQEPGATAPQSTRQLTGWILNRVPSAHVAGRVRQPAAEAETVNPWLAAIGKGQAS